MRPPHPNPDRSKVALLRFDRSNATLLRMEPGGGL